MSHSTGGAVTFEEFAARHLAAVQRFAAVLAEHQTRGDNLVQEVLLRAHARWRSPEAVRFLVSPAARNVTGHDFPVDAGWDV